jgi:hypothetical protein
MNTTQAYKHGVASGNFCRVTRRAAGERENVQSGGMNETDSHEFAFDQAANGAAQNEHVKLPVADPLKEAKAILTDALCHKPDHDENCAAQAFAVRNRHCPCTHPVWKAQPPCTCWVGRLANWLNNNPEI